MRLLCGFDWTTCISDIAGWALASPATSSFVLSYAAVADSIHVWWLLEAERTDLAPDGFVYDPAEQRVDVVGVAPPVGSEVHVHYEIE